MASGRQGRAVMVGVAVVLVVWVGCSSGAGDGEGGGSPPSFGSAVPDERTDGAVVDEAVAVVVERAGASGEVERCARLRLEQQPDLAEALTGSGGGVSGRAAALAADCGRAIELADGFVEGLAGPGASEAERSCVRDVFVGLSAAERVGVTAAVTGTGGEGDLDAAAEMAGGVAACRETEQ